MILLPTALANLTSTFSYLVPLRITPYYLFPSSCLSCLHRLFLHISSFLFFTSFPPLLPSLPLLYSFLLFYLYPFSPFFYSYSFTFLLSPYLFSHVTFPLFIVLSQCLSLCLSLSLSLCLSLSLFLPLPHSLSLFFFSVSLSVFHLLYPSLSFPLSSPRPMFSQGDIAVGRITRVDVANVLVSLLDDSNAQAAVGKTIEVLALQGTYVHDREDDRDKNIIFPPLK